jgi:hypothetical protein
MWVAQPYYTPFERRRNIQPMAPFPGRPCSKDFPVFFDSLRELHAPYEFSTPDSKLPGTVGALKVTLANEEDLKGYPWKAFFSIHGIPWYKEEGEVMSVAHRTPLLPFPTASFVRCHTPSV